MTVVPHQLYIFLLPQLKIKPKGRHVDTTKVIEAESQAMLNTRTEQDVQDTIENDRRWERNIRAKRDCFEGDGGQWAQSHFSTRWQHQSWKLWMAICNMYSLLWQ
jgi:hypothetical protein